MSQSDCSSSFLFAADLSSFFHIVVVVVVLVVDCVPKTSDTPEHDDWVPVPERPRLFNNDSDNDTLREVRPTIVTDLALQA